MKIPKKPWLLGVILCPMLLTSPQTVWANDRIKAMEEIALYENIAVAQQDLASENREYVATANLNLREEPSTDSTKIETYPRGTAVQVTDFMDYEWYAVTVGGQSGYMKAEFLTEKTAANAQEETLSLSAVTSIGTVELVDWSEAKSIFTRNVPVQVIDVRTKLTYWVASFSNGNHADVEPVTTDDTAIMKRTYGGSWNWDPRPILVVIDGRTLAASINGMPHGGGVNSNNGMSGQVCIHFSGSKTHNGNKSHERDHQNAVTEAYNTAQKW